MSQQLTVEISDEIYLELQQKANAVGLSISEWIVTLVSRQEQSMFLSVKDQEQARNRFKSHAGAISLGYATDLDNDSIDADLAKAYANEY